MLLLTYMDMDMVNILPVPAVTVLNTWDCSVDRVERNDETRRWRRCWCMVVQVYDKLKQKNARKRSMAAVEDGKLEQMESGSMVNISDFGRRAVIEFTAAQSAILEQEQRVRVSIRRFGRLDCPVACKWVVVAM